MHLDRTSEGTRETVDFHTTNKKFLHEEYAAVPFYETAQVYPAAPISSCPFHRILSDLATAPFPNVDMNWTT